MPRLRIPVIFLGALLSVTLFAVVSAPAGQKTETLRIGGNGSGLGAMNLLARAYQKLHPEVTVKIAPNLGSTGGIVALIDGALDLAISTRPLRPEELRDRLTATEYARTPFIFVANRGVRETDLTSGALASAYRQETTRWPDGTRIRLILRPETDSDTAYVKKISPEVARALDSAHSHPGMIISVTDQDCLSDTTRTPGGFGTATLTQVVTQPHRVQVLSFNGVQPTLENLANGSYPLSKTYSLVLRHDASPQARSFASFLESPRAREILREAGNLPTVPRREQR